MSNAQPLPDTIGGIPVKSDLSLGLLGEAYLGGDQGTIIIKLLDKGEGFTDPAADPAVIAFASRGEENERAVVAAEVPPSTPVGILTGGSPLQSQALSAGESLDPDQTIARTLRALERRDQAVLFHRLLEDLERLHAAGRTLTAISPWNVLADGERLRVVDVAFALTPDRVRWAHPDALIYLAPEVLRALGGGQAPQASPAADVYALAATARAVLLHRAARPTAETRGAVLERGELDLEPQEQFTSELDDALRAALAVDPSARPSAGALSKAFAAALTGDLDYAPESTWATTAATAMAIVFCIALLMTFLRPQSQEELAVAAFVAASREADPERRDALLEDAWTHPPADGQRPIAAALRLQALDALQRWQANPDPAELEQVLNDLEEHAVQGWDDELAFATRFVVGFLRRWEQREEGRQHGTHLLELPYPTPELSALARAARAMHPAGGDPGQQAGAWLRAAEAAGGEEGILSRPLPQTIRLDPRADPAPTSLQAGWIADLLAGRLLAAQGQKDRALAKLRAAEERIGAFSTEASLGLALVELRGDPREAREVIERAQTKRQTTELQLAAARAWLRQAHEQRTTAAYRAAAEAFRAIEGTTSEDPNIERAQATGELAAVGVMEAGFYAALAKARGDDPGAAAEALTKLLRTYRGNDVFWDRFGPDTRVALGVCLVRDGRGARARRDLLYMFRDRDIRAGWAQLPDLDPRPFTRDRMLVLKALLRGVLDDLPQIRALAQQDPSDARASAREAQSDLNALLALPEAKRLPAFRRELARADLELCLALVSRDVSGGLEEARQALVAVRAKLDPAAEPGPWLTVSRRLEELYRLQHDRARTPAERLPALLGAYEDLQALRELPASAREGAADLRERLEASSREDLSEAISALLSARRDAWDAIRTDAPSYPGPIDLELRALERGVALARAHGELDQARRLRLGLLYWRWAQLLWCQTSAQTFGVARAGLEVLSEAGPKGTALRQRFEHLLGTLAYRQSDLVEDAVKASGARSVLGFARDSLSRACGEADFRALWSKAKGGDYSPRGPEAAARLLATTLVDQVRRAVPDDAGPERAIPKADDQARALRVALQLSPRDPWACVTLALVELSRGKGSSTRLKTILALTARAQAAAQGERDLLEAYVQAVRLECWARELAGQSVADAGFGKRAAAGAKRARELFAVDAQARGRSTNHGPAYWLARHYLQAKDGARAKAAYAAFAKGLGDTPPPPEAAGWKREARAARGGD